MLPILAASIAVKVALILAVMAVILIVNEFMVITQPTGGVLVNGTPLIDQRSVETATNVIPGRLLTKGTADYQVIVCTASLNPLGWCGYEGAQAGFTPSTRATAYGTDDECPMYYGGHFSVLGKLVTGNNVTAGMALKPAAAGKLAIAVEALTTASGSTAVTSVAADGANIVLGESGFRKVAIALESVNATSADLDCAVLSLI